MKNKIGALLAFIVLISSTLVASPAEAAQATTIILDTPTYAQKNLATEIQIHVCSGSCYSSTSRSIALYVDGKKVKSWNSASKDLSYSWKSSKLGSHKVQVKVSVNRAFKAANSAVKKVTVKTGMLNSASVGWYSYTHCPEDRCTEFPVFIVPTDNPASNITIWLGTDDRQDGRRVVLQWKKSDGSWSDEDSGLAEWDDANSEYFVNLQFNFDRAGWCDDSDGSEWTYRIFIPSTAQATGTYGYVRTMHLRCTVPYPSLGNAGADFEYKDQTTSSAPSFWFYTQAESGVGMTLYVETCDLDEGLDCTSGSDWYHSPSSELTISSGGSGYWESRVVNDISGHFLVRGVVVPDDGSTTLYSDSYDVYNPYF